MSLHQLSDEYEKADRYPRPGEEAQEFNDGSLWGNYQKYHHSKISRLFEWQEQIDAKKRLSDKEELKHRKDE